MEMNIIRLAASPEKALPT